MANSFTYDGTNMGVMGIRLMERPVISAPKITENMQDIPGRIGELFFGNNIGSRTITVKIALLCKSQEELNAKKIFVDNTFIQDKTTEYPLVFDEDSLWTYYVHFAGRTDFESTGAIYEVTTSLTFTCSDPRKYGRQIEYPVANNTMLFKPEGYQSTYPILSAIARKDATWCGVTSPDQYVYVGGKVNVETNEIATTLYNPILTDTAQNMALWQRQSNDTFKGAVGGNVGKGSYFKQNADDISVKDFGENNGKKTEWYGPALQRMLTKQLNNYKVTWRIQSMNRYKRAENKLELYLLNSAGNKIGRLCIKDDGEGSEQFIIVEMYKANGDEKNIGTFKPTVRNKKTVALNKKQKVASTDKNGKTTYKYVTIKETLNENKSVNDFTDFYGSITIEKVGNKFFATVIKMDTKTRNEIGNWSATWTDSNNTITQQLAGFCLYAGKRSISEDTLGISYDANYLAFCDLRVWERVDIKSEEVVSTTPSTIIWEGDEIVFDCEQGRVYCNGQKFMDALHIGTDWIEFIGGVQTELSFAEGFDWKITYRPTSY